MTMDWKRPDNIERLTKLWGEGLSASQIAKQFGACSRNAVIGAVHRLGMAKRRENRPVRSSAFPSRRIYAEPSPPRLFTPRPRTPLPVNLKAIAALPPLDPTLSVLKLGAYTCRFPIGDPKDADFAFCGRTCDADEPYCVQHRKLTYVPTNPRRAEGTVRLVNWLDRRTFDATERAA